MNSCFGYLLASRSRVQEHQTKQNPGFTSRYNVNRLVFLEETSTFGVKFQVEATCITTSAFRVAA